MKYRTVSSTLCATRGRLDSNYFLAPGVAARDRITLAQHQDNVEVKLLGGATGLAHVWQPARFKRAYAAVGEEATPYLRPYDVLEHLPTSADLLSIARTQNLVTYQLQPGTILQSCSGRNLGPVAVVDRYLARFALSHDMIRLRVHDEALQPYVYAFLSSPTGQAILRQRMSGSVIDHLTTDDVANLTVPILASDDLNEVARLAGRSLELIEQARLELDGVRAALREWYPSPPQERARKHGWTASANELAQVQRLDPHYHDPNVQAAREQLVAAGGAPIGEVAEAFLPLRYKRYYVDPEHGRPIISGRQLLQIEPVNLRYIANRSFKDPDAMLLHEGMVVFGAVGRWEGRLGEPALITADRDGWLASNDVMRLRPRRGAVDPGWLWLAMSCNQVQQQIAALPYGSVIDHTGPQDVEALVILPPTDNALGIQAREAWTHFAEARARKQQAIDIVERNLASGR